MSNNKQTVFDAEGRTPGIYGRQAIEEAELLTIEKEGDDLTLSLFELPEYQSFCPRSHFPDFASIKLLIVPNKLNVQEQSLKLFTNKFASFRGGHETTVNEYMDAIVPLLKPKYAIIWGNFGIRGNVKTIPLCTYKDENLTMEEIHEIESFIQPYFYGNFQKTLNHISQEF